MNLPSKLGTAARSGRDFRDTTLISFKTHPCSARRTLLRPHGDNLPLRFGRLQRTILGTLCRLHELTAIAGIPARMPAQYE